MRVESVADSFATYRAAVLPAEASAVQVLECQRAFYAGVYFLLMGALLNIGDESTDEEDGIAQLEAIKAECEAFAGAGGAPLPTAVVDEAAPLSPAVLAELERRITVPDIHHTAPGDLVARIRPLLERLGRNIGDDLPTGWGFALFLFSFGENGHTFYISNGDRADVLTALHEYIRRQTS